MVIAKGQVGTSIDGGLNVAIITYGFGAGSVNLHFGNDNTFVATLQAAALTRFGAGQGFFLTLAGTDDTGQPNTRGHWLSPASQLQFIYDTEDEHGNPVKTVILSNESVDALVQAMDRSIGVVWGFSLENNAFIPFMSEETAAEADRRRQSEGGED
jgi:hypothetical protein